LSSATPSGAIGVEQAGRAQGRIPPEGQRVDEVVVDAAIDDVDPAQAGGRAHEHMVVMDDQVATFDQRHTHQSRKVGVLIIGRIVDARRQDHDLRIGAMIAGHALEGRQQQVGIPLYGPHAGFAERAGEGAAGCVAVGQHVGDARRHPKVVFEYEERPVFAADKVAAADIHIGAVRYEQMLHLAPIRRRAQHQIARYDAVLQDPLLAVDVP
jgi:hypothetical protein